ncbi:hypothetical protein [Halovivax gelatinilyticus]|uniref:hypothetical protein n=1 Tax=Halovivax gelatinilyticus TaxID=2961597 RepID=UPI0020CA90FE|nr:hypothetical protein [Halovivax gelatinilyticus]
MRVHPALLLVLVALTVPFVVELRTMAVWVGIELSLVQTAVIGVVLVCALLVWALQPPKEACADASDG